MRIRFRGLDFGLVAKINIIIRAKSKQASCAEMVLGSFFFCSCDSVLRFLDSETSSKRRLLLRPAPRRVHFARPGLEHLSLRSDSSLAAKRRADALHVVFFFNKASEPSTGAAAALCALCVLPHDTYLVATKDARWVRWSPCSLGPGPP